MNFDDYLKKQRKLNEWQDSSCVLLHCLSCIARRGDHVEIVALREMFNKNVEIYDKDAVKGKPRVFCSDISLTKHVSQRPSRWE